MKMGMVCAKFVGTEIGPYRISLLANHLEVMATCCRDSFSGVGNVLRIVRAAGANGVKHEYVRVVEAYREKGKTRHRTILNLGRRDLLAEYLDLKKFARLLHGEAAADSQVEKARTSVLSVHGTGAVSWWRGTFGKR